MMASFIGRHPAPIVAPMAFAYITVHAFTCEAFLKVLTLLEKKLPPLETHNLRHLFNDVSEETQERIRRTWEERHLDDVQGKKVIGGLPSWWTVPRNFDQALDKCAKAFIDWRYTTGTEEKPLQFHLMGLSAILREIILEKKPEWPTGMGIRASEDPFDPKSDFVKAEKHDLRSSAAGGAIFNRQAGPFEIKIRRRVDPKDGDNR